MCLSHSLLACHPNGHTRQSFEWNIIILTCNPKPDHKAEREKARWSKMIYIARQWQQSILACCDTMTRDNHSNALTPPLSFSHQCRCIFLESLVAQSCDNWSLKWDNCLDWIRSILVLRQTLWCVHFCDCSILLRAILWLLIKLQFLWIELGQNCLRIIAINIVLAVLCSS